MNTAELLFATHVAAAAWGGAPLDSGIHALRGSGSRAVVGAGPALVRAASGVGDSGVPGAAEASATSLSGGPWSRFVHELGEAGPADGAPLDGDDGPSGASAFGPGALFTATAVLLRALAAAAPDAAAPELLTFAPATIGDLSALPAHRPLSEFALSHGGAVLVRDPDSGMTAAIAHTTGRRGHRWTVELFADVPMPQQAPSPAHAAASLTDAVHGAAELIAAASGPYARENGGVLPETELVDLPVGISSRCLDLLDRADMVERIRVAALDAETRRGAPAQQQPALWALQSAVNLARRAAVGRFAEEQLERHATTAGRMAAADGAGEAVRGAERAD